MTIDNITTQQSVFIARNGKLLAPPEGVGLRYTELTLLQ